MLAASRVQGNMADRFHFWTFYLVEQSWKEKQILNGQLWEYLIAIPKVSYLDSAILWIRLESKVKPSQVNTEPGTKPPPDTVHKLAAAGRNVETSSSGISHERWREEKREGKCMVFGDASMSAHIKLFSNMQKDFSGTVRKKKNGEGNSVILLEQ